MNHSAAWFLGGVSTHFLVAAHTFLEMVHYGVWIVLIPLVGMRSRPWELRTIPAARRNRSWARGVAVLLLFGLLVVRGSVGVLLPRLPDDAAHLLHRGDAARAGGDPVFAADGVTGARMSRPRCSEPGA